MQFYLQAKIVIRHEIIATNQQGGGSNIIFSSRKDGYFFEGGSFETVTKTRNPKPVTEGLKEHVF